MFLRISNSVLKDAKEHGKLLIDMTPYKDQIPLIIPKRDKRGKLIGKRRYEVTYDLVPFIEGGTLGFYARYPAGPDGEVLKQEQICIAATFRPGTV